MMDSGVVARLNRSGDPFGVPRVEDNSWQPIGPSSITTPKFIMSQGNYLRGNQIRTSLNPKINWEK